MKRIHPPLSEPRFIMRPEEAVTVVFPFKKGDAGEYEANPDYEDAPYEDAHWTEMDGELFCKLNKCSKGEKPRPA